MTATTERATSGHVKVTGIDHLEFCVGNPMHAAHFYRTTFGLRTSAKASAPGRCGFVVSNGDVRFVLNGAVSPEDDVAHYVNVHGDGVRDIAFTVDDVESAYHCALVRGAVAVSEPSVSRVANQTVRRASVRGIGDVIHSFIARDSGEWHLPGFTSAQGREDGDASVSAVDHVAISVEHGGLSQQIEFYKNVFGFHESHEQYVTTGRTAMNSKVVESPDGRVRLPIIEPAAGHRVSQVEDYLRFNRGPGVQHVALLSDDIIRTVATLRERGLDFLTTPETYYDMLQERVGAMSEDPSALRDLNILVDKDPWGYLLQIFSKPIQARPTFFVEIIQRKGGRGFGAGNVKALFEAVERAQQARTTGEPA